MSAKEAGRGSGRVTFWDCVRASVAQAGLVSEFSRLSGHRMPGVSAGRAPIEVMIDEACGVHDAACGAFIEFVWDCVYTRLPLDVRATDDGLAATYALRRLLDQNTLTPPNSIP